MPLRLGIIWCQKWGGISFETDQVLDRVFGSDDNRMATGPGCDDGRAVTQPGGDDGWAVTTAGR